MQCPCSIPFIVLICRWKLRFQQMQNEMLVDVNFSCKNGLGCGQSGCYEVSELCMFLVSSSWQKYDYDSSTVRKKFFREALLQIIIPYMLQQLSTSCSPVSIKQHVSYQYIMVTFPHLYNVDFTVLHNILAMTKAASKNVWKDECVGKL